MKHKWSKKLPGKTHIHHEELLHYVAGCKECVKCKLKKGHVNSMGFHTRLVYFKEMKVLSMDTLPYQCTEGDPYQCEGDSFFLSEKDFEW